LTHKIHCELIINNSNITDATIAAAAAATTTTTTTTTTNFLWKINVSSRVA